MRATAATNNAREYKADIGRVQQWLGHADISTARLYGVAPRTGRRLAPVVTSDWGQVVLISYRLPVCWLP